MGDGHLLRATGIGTALQLAMVVTGHFAATVAMLFGPIGMLNSMIAGLIYARGARTTGGVAMRNGAIAGGVCAFIGILVSWLLGDVPAAVLAFGTASSVVTGAIGGIIGRRLAKPPAGTAA